MRQRIRSNLSYANVMSTVAVVLAIGGGAAYAANTVFSSDIVDGEVKTADIGNNQVRSADVRDAGLAGGGLTGVDIANGSLVSADLGVTMNSGRQPDAQNCGTSAAFNDCVSVPIILPRPQRLLLIASGAWATTVGQGHCLMEVDNNGTFLGQRFFGEDPANSDPANFAMNATTGIVSAGTHQVDVSCRELSGSVTVGQVELSVVAIGDG